MFTRTIALVSMFALAGTTVASPSLVARGGGSCDASGGYVQNCCQVTELADSFLADLLGVALDALVALDCVVADTCDQTAICCTDDQETWGLVNVNIQCVNL
ncbi:hypothetical protein BJ138DRAFT_1160250 [Hygrophoropsis aurantiaca]|uniref:Uncharacterized protein n=1 Tax=Hygrophoropsis aurantiaca TaxID=72124 RepID=A0ACB8A1I4_9AGAM|nr:hypothetical protein BJ138DRAFT_1160250 [Hygrophoropsis aurantiaca]